MAGSAGGFTGDKLALLPECEEVLVSEFLPQLETKQGKWLGDSVTREKTEPCHSQAPGQPKPWALGTSLGTRTGWDTGSAQQDPSQGLGS